MKALPPDPAAALAEAFARRLAAWSTAPTRAAVHEAAQALVLAATAGHVCTTVAPATRAALLASGVAGTPDAPGACPLVVDDGARLYLHRAWADEVALAARLAAAAAQPQGLALVTGGPGTGKTTRVAARLAAWQAETPAPRIALAAPTGKAAARLGEALAAQGLRPATPPTTVHRLLGLRPTRAGGWRPRADAAHPLPIDALVVDEASMLDLALARRLLDAVPPAARLVLVGDADQLAAVEAGAVFAELCCHPHLAPCLTRLQHSYRYAPTSALARLAAAVRHGDAAGAGAALDAPGDATVAAVDAAGADALEAHAAAALAPLARAATPDLDAARSLLARFRVLCAVREGSAGVDAANARATAALRQAIGRADAQPASAWYPGRPLLVTRNDAALGLHNGDVGIALADAGGVLQAWFMMPGGWRALAPARLPPHETAFAMTVHKAQGSEFDEVLLRLPPAPSRALTRELLYTGLTRARQRARIAADATAIAQAAATPAERASGLAARLDEAFALTRGAPIG